MVRVQFTWMTILTLTKTKVVDQFLGRSGPSIYRFYKKFNCTAPVDTFLHCSVCHQTCNGKLSLLNIFFYKLRQQIQHFVQLFLMLRLLWRKLQETLVVTVQIFLFKWNSLVKLRMHKINTNTLKNIHSEFRINQRKTI